MCVTVCVSLRELGEARAAYAADAGGGGLVDVSTLPPPPAAVAVRGEELGARRSGVEAVLQNFFRLVQ